MNEHLRPKLQREVLFQNEQRFSWRQNDSPENLERLLLEETAELREAVEFAMIGACAFEVASELGDVFYLFTKRLFSSNEPVPQAVLDAVAYASEIAELGGFDPNECVHMKIVRNDMKYLHGFANNGYSYEKSRDLSKKQWTLMGGDKKFSEMYLELAEEL